MKSLDERVAQIRETRWISGEAARDWLAEMLDRRGWDTDQLHYQMISAGRESPFTGRVARPDPSRIRRFMELRQTGIPSWVIWADFADRHADLRGAEALAWRRENVPGFEEPEVMPDPSEDERGLLASYRALSDQGRAALCSLALLGDQSLLRLVEISDPN